VQVDRSVVLMGMMGSGKTTIGTMLAERLGVPAVDNDTRISQITGRDNAEYLRSDPAAWRKIEAELVVETLSADEVVVFSLGGGAVAAPETAERLRSSNCTVVWLQADVDVLLERTATAPGTRPMLDGDAGERMRGLLAERTPIYQSLADVVVDATRSPDAIVENIVNALQQREVMS
jgi:shikimate kinase